ncbi:MAG: DNA repair protein RecO [Candidatus Scatovivens sp.]
MGQIKVKGIVISENNMNDFDKMITILTPNGKIGCSAKGARRTKSLLLAGTQFLCFSEFLLYKGSEIYSVNSCEPIEAFYNLRNDLDKLIKASEITKIINDVTTENQNTYNILKLYLNTLYTISEKEKDINLVLSIFKFRLLKILGFTPHIDKCSICGKKENLKYFSFKDDGFKCKNCGIPDKGAIEMSEGTLKSVIYSIKSDIKKIYSITVPDNVINELGIISKIYLEEKLEKKY